MVAMDHQYEQIEDTAMNVLTDLMKDVALELGTEIKRNSEIGMRA